MLGRQAIDFWRIAKDEDLLYEFVSGRLVEVSPVNKNAQTSTINIYYSEADPDPSLGHTFVFKTYNPTRYDYISITIRKIHDIDTLADTIENRYGGYILPVYPRLSLVRSNQSRLTPSNNSDSESDPETSEMSRLTTNLSRQSLHDELSAYFNKLIKHRVIKSDVDLFKLLFIQEAVNSPSKSKYYQILGRLVDLSREYLNKLLTRYDVDESAMSVKDDQRLYQYLATINHYNEQFQLLNKVVESSSKQIYALSGIHSGFKRLGRLEIIKSELSLDVIGLSGLEDEKVKDLTQQALKLMKRRNDLAIFISELKQPFARRYLLREYIKELKAQAIRSRYNNRHESVEKELEMMRHKYQVWTQDLLRELYCNVALLVSLVRYLLSGYRRMVEDLYDTGDPEKYEYGVNEPGSKVSIENGLYEYRMSIKNILLKQQQGNEITVSYEVNQSIAYCQPIIPI